MSNAPVVNGPSQVRAVLVPLEAGKVYRLCVPNLVCKACGVMAVVAFVPMRASAPVDNLPTPFCAVVQSYIEKVIVLPLPSGVPLVKIP